MQVDNLDGVGQRGAVVLNRRRRAAVAQLAVDPESAVGKLGVEFGTEAFYCSVLDSE